MFGQDLRRRIGSLLSKAFPMPEGRELEALRNEMELLKAGLHPSRGNGGDNPEQHTPRTAASEAHDHREMRVLRQEIEILRNEMLENIAALNRLEILTLGQRIQLLNDFGKELPPTVAGRTRTSIKPRGYSFGIITNGQRNEKLVRLIESIRRQNLTNDVYEILIAGCVDEFSGRDGLRTFSLTEAAEQGRLGAMRNVLAKAATFNKFVCLDDDFLLHSGWSNAVEAVKGDFDLATGIIVNPDLSRYCDWVNIIENYTFLRSYSETFAKCQYVTGGYGIYKDHLFVDHSWNDDLGFYQGEDVSFSRKLFEAGYELKFIPEAIVMHDDERYRQKGYGVIRLKSAEECMDDCLLSLKLEQLCPRTLS
ncbi:MAG: glycosyltransferase family 2 protein [Desulfomonile tiedjei]|nr:glycosyltransferase family 2 protein [Desulfomonile tiedjei]